MRRCSAWMRRPPFRRWIAWTRCCPFPQAAPSATDLNTTAMEHCPFMQPWTRPPGEYTAKPPLATPAESLLLSSRKSSLCVPGASRFISFWTICRLTKPPRCASSWSKTLGFSFTSRPPTLPGSTRSNSGSARSSARSLPAAYSLPSPIWPVSCVATSMPIPPMPDLFSGNTRIQLAESAVTNSLGQATSHETVGSDVRSHQRANRREVERDGPGGEALEHTSRAHEGEDAAHRPSIGPSNRNTGVIEDLEG